MPKMALRFLTDENIAKSLVKALRNKGHDVKDIKEERLFVAPDKEIINTSVKEDRINLRNLWL